MDKLEEIWKPIVGFVRDLYSSKNFTQYQLSQRYNISQPSVNEIIKYKTWNHI